jgi:hypothetical protein
MGRSEPNEILMLKAQAKRQTAARSKGFFAAVIRKRLGFDLVSETSEKGRVYRIVDRSASLLASAETNNPV